MDAAERRNEIKNILIVRRSATTQELAEELGVSMRTIQRDIDILTPVMPLDKKRGGAGGIFLSGDYKPYVNTLDSFELKELLEIYQSEEGAHKEVLYRVLRKYGPSNLQL